MLLISEEFRLFEKLVVSITQKPLNIVLTEKRNIRESQKSIEQFCSLKTLLILEYVKLK